MSSHTYSVVIPAYNESARIGATLEKVLKYLTDQDWTAEVIVVNDGSKDDTAEIVRRYASTDRRLRLLENPGNRGKGYSVRTGMLRAVGDLLLFSDADLSSPIEEAAKLFEAIGKGADIAIGSRWLRSELQTQPQSRPRQLLGRAFNLVPRLVLGLNYKDTQCGFKAFTRGAAQLVFPKQRIEGWGFDPELLFLAKNNGLKVAEVPVTWAHSQGTRIRPLRDGTAMVTEMFKIRGYALTGKYAKTAVLRPRVRPQGL
ncbi:MAG: dolichyl-phosphate beta-glucosyltransferase [Candidatus Sulfotelmatobacter sp.]